ncbi:ribulose-phosphate 3-epimerase [uncultured Alistipes sp.]|uniref:ribulose-phosphate 3-epimerase n=1 Tax=uncultured Alistipes sp. TaxID=538949 RepID=UPI00260A9E28|nr:ribulose-phosphate 3-epimerase [uncultured Alistipes sp.]
MQPEGKISVSVMCSDLMNLERDFRELERLGVDYLHVDVTDAHFVPNLTFGVDFIRAMHGVTALPLDIHMMVEEPGPLLDAMDLRSGDLVSLHVEQGERLHGLARALRARGVRFGVVLNPEVPVASLEPYLDEIEWVTLMLVHPGFAGAKLIDGILDKVAEARRYLDAKGYPDVEISVDGSVSCERAAYMRRLGASIFVGGTAGIYRKGMTLARSVPQFRQAISD